MFPATVPSFEKKKCSALLHKTRWLKKGSQQSMPNNLFHSICSLQHLHKHIAINDQKESLTILGCLEELYISGKLGLLSIFGTCLHVRTFGYNLRSLQQFLLHRPAPMGAPSRPTSWARQPVTLRDFSEHCHAHESDSFLSCTGVWPPRFSHLGLRCSQL